MKYALAVVLVLGVAFVIMPTMPVDKGIGEMKPTYYVSGDPRPEKSGLRIALEGRLKWLGF